MSHSVTEGVHGRVGPVPRRGVSPAAAPRHHGRPTSSRRPGAPAGAGPARSSPAAAGETSGHVSADGRPAGGAHPSRRPPMHVTTLVWVLTVGLATAFLLVDVFVIGRRPHEPSMRESATILAGYVLAALLFGAGVWWISGARYAGEYYAGWLTEYSLSVDNLFIFIIIMGRFAVPRALQQTALLIGIILALVLRGAFIAAGAAAISAFSWIFYLFGAFLVYTAVTLARQGTDKAEEYDEGRVVRWLRRRLPLTSD